MKVYCFLFFLQVGIMGNASQMAPEVGFLSWLQRKFKTLMFEHETNARDIVCWSVLTWNGSLRIRAGILNCSILIYLSLYLNRMWLKKVAHGCRTMRIRVTMKRLTLMPQCHVLVHYQGMKWKGCDYIFKVIPVLPDHPFCDHKAVICGIQTYRINFWSNSCHLDTEGSLIGQVALWLGTSVTLGEL